MKNGKITRRDVLKGTGAVAGAAALGATDLFGFAKAWAQSAPWKPEPGAKLQFTRWKRFVQSEDDAFRAIVASFEKATGCSVTVAEEGFDDVQPKASVAANTGQGPDMFWAIYSTPQLFPTKTLDLTDVATYLGKKYGFTGPGMGHRAWSLGVRVEVSGVRGRRADDKRQRTDWGFEELEN